MKSALGGLEGEKQLLLTKWGGGGADEQLDPGGKGSVWWGRRAHSRRGKLIAGGANSQPSGHQDGGFLWASWAAVFRRKHISCPH